MRSLARASRARGHEGEPVRLPIEAVSDLRFVPRAGQLSLWIAAPGVGKSIVALHWVLRSGVPSLYVSADTDRSDQADRAMTILSGASMSEVREDPERYQHYLTLIPRDCRFEFDSAPEPEHLLEMTKAYKMVMGYYPKLIIVDTLGKIWTDAGEETASNKAAAEHCQLMARKTGAHVAALHHATKGYDAGNVPIPMNGVMSGVTKIPEQVVSMWRDDTGNIAFCPLKNRSGPMDPTAMQIRSWARMDTETMTIGSVKPLVFDYDSYVALM